MKFKVAFSWSSEVARGPSLTTVGALGAQLLTGVAGALLARTSGPRPLGEVSAALAVVALASDVCDFGTGTLIARQLASNEIDVQAALRLMALRFRMYLIVAVSTVAGSAALNWQMMYIAAAGCYLLAFGVFLSITAVLRAVGSYGVAALSALVERLVLLSVCGVAGITHNLSGPMFILALAAGSSAAATLALVAALLRVDHVAVSNPESRSILDLYREARHLGISGLATDLSILETPLVAFGAGSLSAGFYGAGSRLATPLFYPANGAATVILRRISADRHRKSAVRRELRSQRWFIAINLGIIAFAAGLSRFIVPFVFGDAFKGTAVSVFQILCGTSAVTVLIALVYSSLIALRVEKRSAICQWVVVPLGLLSTFSGAYLGGAVYAALGGLAAQIVQLVWLTRIMLTETHTGTSGVIVSNGPC